MKISVITITRGDGPLLLRCIESVRRQHVPASVEIEHIIVDGNDCEAMDYAAEYPAAIIVHDKPRGCYHACNTGLKHATGDIICMVNGTDFLRYDHVLADAAAIFAEGRVDFTFGDVEYVAPGKENKTIRHYSASKFSPDKLLVGFAPPHPSLFIRREAMERVGDYREDFVVASDFEFFLRLFLKNKELKWQYMPRTVVAMHNRGLSSNLHARIFINTPEKQRALRENGYNVHPLRLLKRYLYNH